MSKYTSLELSKWLHEKGFKGESKQWWKKYNGEYSVNNIFREGDNECYPAYDILNDLCVRYSKKLFGETGYYTGDKSTGILTMREAGDRVEEFKEGLWFRSHMETAEAIFNIIQQGKDPEEYIKSNIIL